MGDEIFQNLWMKNKILIEESQIQVKNLKNELEKVEALPETTVEESIVKEYKIKQIEDAINQNYTQLDLIQKISKELEQMKMGTIALVNQITTISKQRIYNPKKDFDILAGIKLSDDKMSLIDEKIKKLYVN